RHLLAVGLAHGTADGVGHLLDAGLRDHAASRGADLAADLGAFLEGPAWAFAVVAAALLIDVGAADRPRRRVRDLLLDGFGHRTADGVGHLLLDGGAFLEAAAGGVALMGDALLVYVGAADLTGHRVGHLLHDGVGHLLADGVGHLLANLVLD